MRAHHVVATGRSVALSIRRYLWPKCLTLRYVDHISWWRNCRRIDFDNNSRARHVHQRHGPPMSVGCHAISTSKVITKDLVRLVRLRRRLWLAKWQRCVHVIESGRSVFSQRERRRVREPQKVIRYGIWDYWVRSKLVPGFSKFVLHFIANLQRHGNFIMETETQRTNSIRQMRTKFIVIQQRKRILAAKSIFGNTTNRSRRIVFARLVACSARQRNIATRTWNNADRCALMVKLFAIYMRLRTLNRGCGTQQRHKRNSRQKQTVIPSFELYQRTCSILLETLSFGVIACAMVLVICATLFSS